MDTGAGEDARKAGAAGVFTAKVEGAMHGGGAVADADGEDGSDARVPCVGEECFAVGVVAFAIEVGVGIYEQGCSSPNEICFRWNTTRGQYCLSWPLVKQIPELPI